jgi:hypothetical protein
VTAGHFVSDGYFSLLSDIYADNLIYSGRELIARFTGEYLDVYYDTLFAVRNLKGCIADFSCLLAEYCAEQSFLCGKLGFALRCNLTYEDIVCSDLGTYFYDTVGIEILQRVLAAISRVISSGPSLVSRAS